MADNMINIKYFEALIDQESCKRMKKLIGNKDYTEQEIVDKTSAMPEKDAKWVLSVCKECQALEKKRTNLTRVIKIFSVITALWLLVIFIQSLMIGNIIQKAFLFVTMIVFFLIYKLLTNFMKKRINQKINCD